MLNDPSCHGQEARVHSVAEEQSMQSGLQDSGICERFMETNQNPPSSYHISDAEGTCINQ